MLSLQLCGVIKRILKFIHVNTDFEHKVVYMSYYEIVEIKLNTIHSNLYHAGAGCSYSG